MQTLEYRTIDKAAWPARGEWDNEPDKVQWPDAATGLPCLIVRGPSGALCGYVGVPKGHPYHGKDYETCDVDVHGGLTFADGCSHGADESHGVCHVPGEGEPDDVWWLGFDTAHYGDMSPAYRSIWCGGTYRTIAYVRAEVTRLAKQLSEIE